jgi:hypothetical protein
MDDVVARSIAKWPGVPAVYGWLELDRRGNWRIKGEKISNVALREFIARNYEADSRGCWFFQNGPQRVFVSLAYTPWVVHHEGDAMLDHCGRPFAVEETFLDEEGSVLVVQKTKIALLDDRDLGRYAASGERLPRLAKAEIPARFGFVAQPADSLR